MIIICDNCERDGHIYYVTDKYLFHKHLKSFRLHIDESKDAS